MFPIFQDQGLSRVCEVGIELPNLEPLKISGEIVDYDINPNPSFSLWILFDQKQAQQIFHISCYGVFNNMGSASVS